MIYNTDMEKDKSTTRQIENEVVFRRANERVQTGLEHEISVAADEGIDHSDIEGLPIHFYCECSDENCHERIVMTIKEYKAIHRNRKQFVISPGHEVHRIEDKVKEKELFSVVKKHHTPPENITDLQPTETYNV